MPPETRGVGSSFQTTPRVPHLSVEDNVGFGLDRLRGRPAARGWPRCSSWWAWGISAPLTLTSYRGPQQRVAWLARSPRPPCCSSTSRSPTWTPTSRADAGGDRDHPTQDEDDAIFVTHDPRKSVRPRRSGVVLCTGGSNSSPRRRPSNHHPASQFVAEFVGRRPTSCPGGDQRGHRHRAGNIRRQPAMSSSRARVEVMIRPGRHRLSAVRDGSGLITRRSSVARSACTASSCPWTPGALLAALSSTLPTGCDVRAQAHVLHVVTSRRGRGGRQRRSGRHSPEQCAAPGARAGARGLARLHRRPAASARARASAPPSARAPSPGAGLVALRLSSQGRGRTLRCSRQLIPEGPAPLASARAASPPTRAGRASARGRPGEAAR